MKSPQVFIAGVMQGNLKKLAIHSQDYRRQITAILQAIDTNTKVVDPDKTDPNRLNYNQAEAERMFMKYCDIAGKVDLLIAFIPEASMGSAIEMWKAYQSGIPILTVSPLKNNWVVKILSKKIYTYIDMLSRDSMYIKSLLIK